MKKLKQLHILILTITSSILGFIGYLMIRGALRHFDNYVSHIMLGIGIVFVIVFALVMLVLYRISKRNSQKIETEQIADTLDIIRNGIKISIDLETVQIKSNHWTDTRFIETNTYDIEIKEDQIQTILQIEIELNGQKHTFYWPSDKEPKSLEMYFAIQKKTYLYIDRKNPEHFYLDLSFMN